MFLIYGFLVASFYLFTPQVKCVQLRLVNSDNKDNSYSGYNNNQKPDSYSYNYGVSDENTGDTKSKWEKRENNVVRGAYSVVDADGSTRLVEYTADANGFRPVITKLDASSNPTPNLSPAYIAPSYSSLNYGNAYNNQRIPTSNYNYDSFYNARGNSYPTNLYRSPILNDVYNNGQNNRVKPTGYRGYYDESTLSGAPYHLSLRPDRQPVPLLHSTYHGYDNLYH